MDISSLPPQNLPPQTTNRYPRNRIAFLVVAGIVLGIALIFTGGGKRQIAIKNPFARGTVTTPTPTPDPEYSMPEKEPNRLDILVLGIRGENDPDASDGGPLLTDSIQIFSYDKVTKKASLISIPRDLYVKIHDDKKDKINSAYEYGIAHSPNSLEFIKNKFSQVSGVYIDDVVVFDFSSFKEIVDALGGVDVTLAAPFSESQQWGYKFSLPAGLNHLNGQDALYYARSRYSSTDFDRSRRQQQIMFAIKDKLSQLNFLSDPVKSFQIVNLIRSDIKTTLGIWNIRQYLDIANNIKFDQMKRTVISTDNLLVDGRENGSYILLPKNGNLSEIKTFFKNSLN